jgi:predicted enzyme related to lactoylglutathione lyase
MNSVVHFEIPFDDKPRAKKFYTEVFGWQLTEFPQMEYVMAATTAVDEQQRPKDPGAINGGMFQRIKDAPHPTIYIAVSSIDEALKKIANAGGKVVTPKTPIPDMGAFARVTDTEGNVIGMFEMA